MSRKADFTQSTRELLAKRAGNHCSFPNCYLPTDGPSDESEEGTSSTGMACHIIAASDGPAARRVEALRVEQLKDPSNGIWMCYTHGKLIDTDECQYSVSVLRSWKEIAELRAKLAQKFGWCKEFDAKLFSTLKLPEHTANIPGLANLNKIIGTTIHECCAEVLWGREQAEAARDLVIEIARNAFEHGGASDVRLEITPRSIKVFDDGALFDSSALREKSVKSGGSLAARRLFSAFHHSLFYFYRRENGKNCNEIALVRSSGDLAALTPCTIEVGIDALREDGAQIHAMEGCEIVYVVFPDFFALSDAIRLPRLLSGRLPVGKEYVLVGRALSGHVLELLSEVLPGVRVINFDYEINHV